VIQQNLEVSRTPHKKKICEGLSVYDRTDNEGKWLGGVLDGHGDAWNVSAGHLDTIVQCSLYREIRKTWHIEKVAPTFFKPKGSF
jgi:hypothetical protein